MSRKKKFSESHLDLTLDQYAYFFSKLLLHCISTENCRQVEINPSIEDHSLSGHVFTSMAIEESSACEVNCFAADDCASFNVKPLQSGDHLCELSNSSDVVHPEDLKEEQGTVYTSFKVRVQSQLILCC